LLFTPRRSEGSPRAHQGAARRGQAEKEAIPLIRENKTEGFEQRTRLNFPLYRYRKRESVDICIKDYIAISWSADHRGRRQVMLGGLGEMLASVGNAVHKTFCNRQRSAKRSRIASERFD
jgi:hypothetical protein